MQDNEGVFNKTPFNGVEVKQINAQPGREPTGYRLRDPEVGTVDFVHSITTSSLNLCLYTLQPGCSCDDLSGQGCCAVALLLIFGCWPCAFLPCCMPDCKEVSGPCKLILTFVCWLSMMLSLCYCRSIKYLSIQCLRQPYHKFQKCRRLSWGYQ